MYRPTVCVELVALQHAHACQNTAIFRFCCILPNYYSSKPKQIDGCILRFGRVWHMYLTVKYVASYV